MKRNSFRFILPLAMALALALLVGGVYAKAATWEEPFLSPFSLVAGDAMLEPAAGEQTARITSAVSVAYDEEVGPRWVNPQGFAVRGMQSGGLSESYGLSGGWFLPLRRPELVEGSKDQMALTAKQAFNAGELVPGSATTDFLSLVDGSGPAAPTVWQPRSAATSGTSIFSDSGQSLGSSNSIRVALGDLDGDGDLDAFVTNDRQGNRVWLNDGTGTFTDSGQSLGSSSSYNVALGDLDGDGDLDAFVANHSSQANRVWLNDGTGGFSDSGQSLGSSSSLEVGLGDLDGDGDLDAFVANNGQANRVWLNDGTASFSHSGQNLGSSHSFGVGLGDLDGDGDLDAFVANHSSQANRVWLNDGTGSFSDSGQSLGSSQSYDMALGDLDGDGDLDAFIANYPSQANRVWLNDGTGTFTDSGQSLGTFNSLDVGLGDLDRDGDLDAFVANYNSQANRVWLNDGTGSLYEGQSLGSSHSHGVALGDLEGDGDLDAFVANYSQANKVWLNNHPAVVQPPTTTDVIYVSANDSGSIAGVSALDEDILLYEDGSALPWSLHFDASDVNVAGEMNALMVLDDNNILLSFEADVTLPGLGAVADQDIVRFVPSQTGETIGGHFEWYIDGSDVELGTNNENIDAIGRAPDGRILISTTAAGAVTGVSFGPEDIIAFTPSQLGETTSGTWEMYFDGSDVGLSSAEDIDDLWVDSSSGEIYLTTSSNFAVETLSGTSEDIFVCLPGALGEQTGCAAWRLFFDGSEAGLTAGHVVNGFSIRVAGDDRLLYLSTASNTTVNLVTFDSEDIIGKDSQTGRWELYFDGSDVMAASANLNAFQVLTDSILMSFEASVILPDLGHVGASDIVRFVPTSTGDRTAGGFERYFQGLDVELSTDDEHIDAFGLLSDGRLLISTVGSGVVTGVAAFNAEDLLAFTPTTLGESITGTWGLYFDGDDVDLSGANENIVGLHQSGPTDPIYLTTHSTFAVTGVSGDGSDLVSCTHSGGGALNVPPLVLGGVRGGLGDTTTCDFDIAFDGSAEGFPSNRTIDGFSVAPHISYALPPQESADQIYLSSSDANGSVGGVSAAEEDIVYYDESSDRWQPYFDGSDLGLSAQEINAFTLLGDSNHILINFESAVTLPDLGAVDRWDIVRFVPSSTGESTVGRFEWYFDGSDVGLVNGNYNIDAFAIAADGRLLISMAGSDTLTDGPAFTYHDILAFSPTQLGQTTGGTWAMYFDGSDVGLTTAAENIVDLWVDSDSGKIYLTTLGAFSVLDVDGDGADIFVCTPFQVGETTICAFEMFFDGSEEGLSGQVVDGFSLEFNQGLMTLYLSTAADSTPGHLSFQDEDILLYDRSKDKWDIYFDGTDVGVAASADVNAFLVLTDTILMSFESTVTLPDLGSVVENDLVRFVITSTGESTAGYFEWYLDGSDVDLSGTGEDIDAIGIAPDGRLLISTAGSGAVTGVSSFTYEDLIAFTPTELGETSSGTWEAYLDGSNPAVDLTTGNETIAGVAIESSSHDIYLSAGSAFSVFNLSGDGSDILICTPILLTDNDARCHYSMLFDGSAEGFNYNIDGLSVQRELISPTPSPLLRIGDHEVVPNNVFTVTLEAFNVSAQGLAAADISLTYDNTDLQFVNCAVDNDFVGACNGNSSGTVQLNATTASAAQGQFDLVQIAFRALALSGDSTINITANSFADPNSNPIAVSSQAGLISFGQTGDVDCNTQVEIKDALFMLQYGVNLRSASDQCPPPNRTLFLPNCDVNEDQTCNVNDALFLVQCNVGIPNTFCPATSLISRASQAPADQPPAQAEQNANTTITITIPSADTSLSGALTLPIRANIAEESPIAAVSTRLYFDPAILSISACQIASPLFGVCNYDHTLGVLSFEIIAPEGITGEHTLANITIQPQTAGDTTLTLDTQTIADTNGHPHPFNQQHGTLSVSSHPTAITLRHIGSTHNRSPLLPLLPLALATLLAIGIARRRRAD